jgi:hypothetical protein
MLSAIALIETLVIDFRPGWEDDDSKWGHCAPASALATKASRLVMLARMFSMLLHNRSMVAL